MERKLIFLDIDGTIVEALSAPSPLVRRAVQGARARGHMVFLCTGRNLAIIGQDILEIGFDGVVASAGGYVAVGDEVLLDSLLPEQLVQECLDILHSRGLYCRIETADGIYSDPQMEALVRMAAPDPGHSELIRMQKELEAGLPMRKYADYPRQGAYKICFTSASLAPMEAAQEALGDRFDFVVHPYRGRAACFNGEMVRKGVDKGCGIQLVCQHLGADLQDTIAFGDSMNDSGMMRCVGISIAMGNACEELKAVCDLVCGDVAHDGVYHELVRMGLC